MSNEMTRKAISERKSEMHKLITLIIVSSIFLSCAKSKKDYVLPEKLQPLTYVSTGCVCQPYVKEYMWRFQVIYLYGSAGPTCQFAPLYYDIIGNPVTMPQGYSLDQFLAEATFVHLMWSCGN